MKLLNKLLSLISVFLLFFYQMSFPLAALAQESTQSASQESAANPSPTPDPTTSPTPTIAPSTSPEVSTQATPAVTETPSPTPSPTSDVSPNPIPDQTTIPTPAESPVGQPNAPPSSATPSASPTSFTQSAHGNLAVSILHNNQSAPKLDLNPSNQTSSATLTTDKADYSPTDAAIISGSGFNRETTYTLVITSSDPPAVNFETQITTDKSGGFIYSYQLDGNYRPNYSVVLKDKAGTVVATTTFTDSRTINSATLNGSSSVTVASGDSITANVNVTTDTTGTGSGKDNWKSTDWLISTTPPGSVTCVNHADHTSAGTFTETFAITAPVTAGTYNAYFIAYNDDACTSGASATITLSSGVIVNNPPVANTDNAVVNEDTPVAISVLANDTDADGNIDPTTVTVTSGPSNGSTSVNPATGAITYTPAANFNGADSFIYRVSDTAGANATATVNITVNAVNDSPSFDPIADQIINEDAPLQYFTVTNISPGPTNESDQTVTLSATSSNTAVIPHPSVYQLDPSTLRYTPVANASGTATITVTANDGQAQNNTFSRTFTITVIPNGHVIIVKDAVSNNIQDFTFQNNFGNGNPNTFLLDDDGNEANTLKKSRDSEVLPGNYLVSENEVAGWKLSSAVCDNGSSVDNISVSAGETVTCIFTNKQLGTIVLVKNTLGGDGTFDFEMSGQSLPNFTQITTDQGSGIQTFNDIDPDSSYSIWENIPEGWELTDVSCVQDNGTVKDNNGFNIATGATVTCIFTNTKYGSISGYKFHDYDGDGVWDDDEDPIEDWTIFLYQGGDLINPINETTTDWWEWGDWGFYSFNNLLPGTYRVCENMEDAWTQTTPWDNSLCPNGDGYEINLSAGEEVTGQNFGNFQYGRISGYKFEDLDGDGVWDENETGLSGWTIFLDRNNNGIPDNGEDSRITGDNGFYEFTNLRGDTYKVREIQQEGWAQTTDNHDITIHSASDEVADFGNFKKVIITGLKWKDLDTDGQPGEGEPGIEGWNIDVSTVTTTSFIPDGGGEPIPIEIVQLQLTSQTNEDGQFTAQVDRPGAYRITEQPQDNFQGTWPVDSFFDIFVEVSGQEPVTVDKNGNPLRFGNAPFQQFGGAKFVPTSGDATSSASLVVLGSSTISVSNNGGTSTVFLPDGTMITRSDGGTIDSSLLSAQDISTSSLSNLGSGVVADGALQWGVPNLGLEFSQPITLSIFVGASLNGQTLNVLRSIDGVTWTNDGIVAPATCVVASGLCTFQATKASFYSATHTVSATTTSSSSSTSTSGGGGGGGGDDVGASAPSCNDPVAGGAPTLLSATVSGSNQVTLTWSKAADPVTHYVITYGLTPGVQQYGNPNVGGKDTTSYTVGSLSGNTTYYFKVRAGNGCNAGPYSNELSTTPGGGAIAGPAAGFTPGVLGVSTEQGNVGTGEDKGLVKGEATASAQEVSSPTPQSQTTQGSSPFNIKVIAIIVILLLGGFGIFRFFIK